MKKNVLFLTSMVILILLGACQQPLNVLETQGAGKYLYPQWEQTTVYNSGDRVTWSGRYWEAKWWTTGEEPGSTGEWGVWKFLGFVDGPLTPTTTPTVGTTPTATAEPTATATTEPTATSTVIITPTPTPTMGTYPAWEAAPAYVKGDKVIHNGKIWEAKWWNMGEEPTSSPNSPWKEVTVIVTPTPTATATVMATFTPTVTPTPTTGMATEIPADNPNIQYYGRIDFTNPKTPTYDWPGIYIKATFEGTMIGAVFNDGTNRYDIFIDDIFQHVLITKGGTQTYTLADNLSPGIHTVTISKRTESNWSTASFLGFVLADGKTILPSPAKPARKIEFIGDSFTAGYGCESPSRDGGDPEYVQYTNTRKAYGPVTASAFGAQYHITAYSGKGMARNAAGAEAGKEFPQYYGHTLNSKVNLAANPTPDWDFSSWIPEVVVIHLGLNDFGGETAPPATYEDYRAKYREFIANLRTGYPGVKMILMATYDWPHDLYRNYIQRIIAEETTAGTNDLFYYTYSVASSALHWHPNVAEQQIIADGLILKIAEITGWTAQ